jgi:hypothetical protein
MTEEQRISVDGVPVPISEAAKAVKRSIRAIQIIDKLLQTQGFASGNELRQIRKGLIGEDVDQNVASAGPPL